MASIIRTGTAGGSRVSKWFPGNRTSSGHEHTPVTDAKLRQMLIDEIKRQNKPYGLYFEDITGGFTTTQRAGLQAFKVIPVIVYRVYADGRPDELIRGADIVGTPLHGRPREAMGGAE